MKLERKPVSNKMPFSWIDQVQSTHQLTVYAHSSMGAGPWRGILANALSEFNALARQHRLGVTLSTSDHPPASDERGGANVSVQAASGRITFNYAGVATNEAFDGTRLHGRTLIFRAVPGQRIFKAFVFVPGQPQVNTPRGQRLVGPNVCLVILVHELVHACGLTNDDHTNFGDLFQAYPGVQYDASPARDRVELGRYGGGTAQLTMPPLVLSDQTVQLIQSVWPQSATPAPQPATGSRSPVGRAPDRRHSALHQTRSAESAPRPHVSLNHFRQPGTVQYIPPDRSALG